MPDGKVAQNAQLFGMEAFARGKLRVLAGDISTLDTASHNIAAVYYEDDYGTPQMDSHWAKLGDTITLRHIDSWEYVDDVTGEILDPDNLPDDNSFHARAKTYRDISYTVTALVSVPYPLSYRYFGSDEFVLNDQTFIEDTQTAHVMLYAFNMQNATATADMEQFLSSFTQNQEDFDYESKSTYAAEFESFRSMFLLLGSLLSLIVGLIGILNFFNAILTGIITRRREFAVLQAIGMTGRQLKEMLTLEGLLYTLGSLAITLFASITGAPLVGKLFGNLFCVLPLSLYHHPHSDHVSCICPFGHCIASDFLSSHAKAKRCGADSRIRLTTRKNSALSQDKTEFFLLHQQTGQEHNLIHIAFNLDLSCMVCFLHIQLTGQQLSAVCQSHRKHSVSVDIFIRHDRQPTVQNFNIEYAANPSGQIHLNGKQTSHFRTEILIF